MDLPLPLAPPADVVRARAKDEECLDDLHSHLHEALVHVIPNNVLSHPVTDVILRKSLHVCYHSLTSSGSLPTTPGEEYASTLRARIQRRRGNGAVNGGGSIVPADVTSRFVSAAIDSISVHDIVRLLAIVWRRNLHHVRNATGITHRTQRNDLTPSPSGNVEYAFPRTAVHAALDAAIRLHTAVFYWRGGYASVGDRLLRLRHVQTAAGGGLYGGAAGWAWSRGRVVGLEMLAIATVVQMAAQLVLAVRRAVRRVRVADGGGGGFVGDGVAEGGGDGRGVAVVARWLVDAVVGRKAWAGNVLRALLWPEAALPSARTAPTAREAGDGVEGRRDEVVSQEMVKQCVLCLEGVRDATLTTCGHVFCWECICNWCSSNEVCPLCRREVVMRKLVCLYNY